MAGPGQGGEGVPLHGDREPGGVQRAADAGGAGRRRRPPGGAEPFRRPDGRRGVRGVAHGGAPAGGPAAPMRPVLLLSGYALAVAWWAPVLLSRLTARGISPRLGLAAWLTAMASALASSAAALELLVRAATDGWS